MPKSRKAAEHAHAQPSLGASPGDTVRAHSSRGTFDGILLPRNESDGFITIKLSTGYNIGLDKGAVERIELISRANAPVSSRPPSLPASRENGGAAKEVMILGCGGTIASRIDYKTGAVYPATTPQELLSSFPAIDQSKVGAKTLFSLLSEDLSPSHWGRMAQAAADSINDGAKGIVITHGTDTMSFTSAALSFMLPGVPCPIVLTGSQRSSDRGSSDAESNMRASVIAASSDLSGVFVCMHEDLSDNSCLLHFGAKVRKMHTSRRDAFRSISCKPAARISLTGGKMEAISERALPRHQGKAKVDAKVNDNVALIHSYPGMKPQVLSSLSSYDGVVIAGTGLGHLCLNLGKDPLSVSLLEGVQSLISSGIPVVMAPQALHGRINLNTYATGRTLLQSGVIGNLCDFTPEAAYVKLMWVLGHEKKMEKVKEIMEKDIAGEITARSEISDY